MLPKNGHHISSELSTKLHSSSSCAKYAPAITISTFSFGSSGSAACVTAVRSLQQCRSRALKPAATSGWQGFSSLAARANSHCARSSGRLSGHSSSSCWQWRRNRLATSGCTRHCTAAALAITQQAHVSAHRAGHPTLLSANQQPDNSCVLRQQRLAGQQQGKHGHVPADVCYEV